MQSTNTHPSLPASRSLTHTYNRQSAMDNRNHWCACAAAVRQRAALWSASPVAPPPPCISTSSSLAARGRRKERCECASASGLLVGLFELSGVCQSPGPGVLGQIKHSKQVCARVGGPGTDYQPDQPGSLGSCFLSADVAPTMIRLARLLRGWRGTSRPLLQLCSAILWTRREARQACLSAEPAAAPDAA